MVRSHGPDLAALLTQVDPAVIGGRVRAAREGARLSPVELAHAAGLGVRVIDDVERGAGPPDLAVLDQVAVATSTTATALLTGLTPDLATDLEGDLDRAALGLSTATTDDALATADRVLDRLAAATDVTAPHLERAALRLRATAREASGDLAGTITDLTLVTADPLPEIRWIHDLIALSRCHRNAGDLDRAVAVGKDAEAAIHDLGLTETDAAFQLVVTVACAYLSRGEVDRAIRICQRAADDATRLGLHLARASALWNHSLALLNVGYADEALTDALEALQYFAARGDTRNLGRLRIHVATVCLALDPPDPARALDLLALARDEIDWSTAGAVDRSGHRLISAHALHLLGNDRHAAEMLAESESATPDGVTELRAWQTALRGRIRAAHGDLDSARGHLQDAVGLLRSIDSRSDSGQLWFELGDILTALDEPEQARDAYRRAAVARGLRRSS